MAPGLDAEAPNAPGHISKLAQFRKHLRSKWFWGSLAGHSHLLHCHDQRAAQHAVVLVAVICNHHSTLRAIHPQPRKVFQVHIRDMRVARHAIGTEV